MTPEPDPLAAVNGARTEAPVSVADHVAEHGEAEAAGRAMPPRPKRRPRDRGAESLAFWQRLVDEATAKYKVKR
jgi:hypothetical protein